MTGSTALGLFQQILLMAAILGGPVLVVALAIGVVVSLVQAITQVQDMTLTFVPKLVAISLTLLLLGSWMLQHAVTFTERLFANIPAYVR
jgi:flagellar biosynthesis protein FliQ